MLTLSYWIPPSFGSYRCSGSRSNYRRYYFSDPSGKTRLSALRLVVEQINQVGGNILGVILNDVELQGKPYAYQYKYYRNYSAYQGYYGKGNKSNQNKHDFSKY